MTGLTTHVLDTSIGKPAKDLKIELYKITENKLIFISSFLTNIDGRVSKELLDENEIKKGNYQLNFHVGDYFNLTTQNLPEIKFLDIVSINFGINNTEEHYHVPLLVSPFGYTTYRGS